MPEGPEVQTVVSTLERQIKNCRVEKVELLYPKIFANGTDISWNEQLVGQTLLEFNRVGKYLILTTEDYDWVIHLRMEGKFYLYEKIPEDRKHIHVIISLSDGRFMCYHDVRKFGRMYLYEKRIDKSTLPALKNVGYDILDEKVTGQYLYQTIHVMKRSLKSILLDQAIMAGIGNIYADEICFSAKLDPRLRTDKLSKKDCEMIVFHAKRIIKGAIQFGGTTIRSYTSSLGVTGLFQLKLKVHTRVGEPCVVCGNEIKKIVVSNRGTYLCQTCQKRK